MKRGVSPWMLGALVAPAALGVAGAFWQGAGVAVVAPVAAQTAAKPAGVAAEAQPPVRISSEAAEYFNEQGLVIFLGNVVATQADSTLTADRMEVRLSEPAGGGGDSTAAIASAGRRITSLTALGRVSFRQIDPETKKERYATGDKGVYDADRRLVTMSGSPRLWEGKNVIVGEEMVFHLDDRKVVVTGKVNLTVYPEETKEGRKP